MALGQKVQEEIAFEIEKKCTRYENGLSLGQGHVAQGPSIKNLYKKLFTDNLKIMYMKFDGSGSNGQGGDRF